MIIAVLFSAGNAKKNVFTVFIDPIVTIDGFIILFLHSLCKLYICLDKAKLQVLLYQALLALLFSFCIRYANCIYVWTKLKVLSNTTHADPALPDPPCTLIFFCVASRLSIEIQLENKNQGNLIILGVENCIILYFD